jgi:hypothetical protein
MNGLREDGGKFSMIQQKNYLSNDKLDGGFHGFIMRSFPSIPKLAQ